MDYATETLLKAHRLLHSGNLAKAELLYKKLAKAHHGNPDVLHLQGLIAIRKGQYESAISTYRNALYIKPNIAPFHYNLAIAHINTGQFDEAVRHLEHTIQIDPTLTQAYCDLCLALTRSGNIESALTIGRKAVELLPDHPASHYNLALALDRWKDFETAFSHYQRAATLAPEHLGIQFNLGNMYANRGELEQARRCFQKILKEDPFNLAAYRNLIRITRYTTPDHQDVKQLKTLLNNKSLTDDQRTSIFFDLGKIHQDCELFDEAFNFFIQGNQLQDVKHNFSTAKFIRHTHNLQKHYTQNLIDRLSLHGNPSETPVFIVGTPRSGTTLVEQILSSHGEVFGAGELEWFGKAVAALPDLVATTEEYPTCIENMEKSTIEDLAIKYLLYLKSLASGQRLISDKMPTNFLHIGLIHILFPKAKIIHCQRNPLDSCISMFCNYFTEGTPFSYDLYKLGIFYRGYQKMMAHWKKTLPPHTIIDLGYEQLVAHQESETRRLLSFLDLEWDNACLEFYKQKRRVFTASDQQVRKPMYSSSIGRWKYYEKHLQPLIDGLNSDSINNDTDNNKLTQTI